MPQGLKTSQQQVNRRATLNELRRCSRTRGHNHVEVAAEKNVYLHTCCCAKRFLHTGNKSKNVLLHFRRSVCCHSCTHTHKHYTVISRNHTSGTKPHAGTAHASCRHRKSLCPSDGRLIFLTDCCSTHLPDLERAPQPETLRSTEASKLLQSSQRLVSLTFDRPLCPRTSHQFHTPPLSLYPPLFCRPPHL